jgi:hypothetical protein
MEARSIAIAARHALDPLDLGVLPSLLALVTLRDAAFITPAQQSRIIFATRLIGVRRERIAQVYHCAHACSAQPRRV